MKRFRRHRKRVLVVAGLVVVGGVVVIERWRSDDSIYRPGETPEGIVDATSLRGQRTLPSVEFVDVATEAGITHVHFPGTRSNLLPEDMGSGVALGDVDGDGWTDVFFPNLEGPLRPDGGVGDGDERGDAGRSRLYRNLGGGRFEDITERAGIDLVALANAAAFVDVDGDADLDLCVTTYPALRLWRNDGEMRFTEVTDDAGLAQHHGFWAGIGAADMDLDGDVDLYVCNYVDFDVSLAQSVEGRSQYGRAIPAGINPSTYEPAANLLLMNDGAGRFTDVAEERGVDDALGRSLGALFCDLDGNGWPDLYVANDVSDNALFLGLGDGAFVDATAASLMGDYRGAMGLAAGDHDGDGTLDVFVTHWVAQENALYVRRGESTAPTASEDGEPELRAPVYFDDASPLGLGHSALNRVGWATGFIDFDNDARPDLFVANGSTIPLTDDPLRLEPMRSQLYWQTSGARPYYEEIGPELGAWFAERHVGRGGAAFDFDLDGDEDLLFTSHGEAPVLLRNDGGNAAPSLRVRLRQSEGERFALGARVVVESGGIEQLRIVDTQGSYLSQHATGEVHFGLGRALPGRNASARVDRLEVTWPDGTVDSLEVLPASSLVTWERGGAPTVEPFVGRRALDVASPADAAAQRRFFERRDDAIKARLSGDFAAAADAYFECLAMHPGHGDALYYLGNSLVHLGREQSAQWIFERLVTFEPTSSPGWMQLGLLHLPGGDASLDDVATAEACFERCHAINKEESKPLTMLGVAAMLTGRDSDAMQRFEQAMALDPKAADAPWFAGEIAHRRGDPERARELLALARTNVATAGGGASVLDEGATRGGRTLVGEGGVPLDARLTRWRTLGQREVDVEEEFGSTLDRASNPR